MAFLTATFLIIAILFMLVFIFIGIWLFILAIKSHRQLRYQNYILEKICQKLNILSDKMNLNDSFNYLDDEIMSDDSDESNENNTADNNIFDFDDSKNSK